MNFIEAVRKMKEGKVFRREENHSDYEYYFADKNGQIMRYEYQNAEPYQPEADDVLAADWKECKKERWYIEDLQRETSFFSERLLYSYYLISKDERYGGYGDMHVSPEELKKKRLYLDIQIDPETKDDFSEKDIAMIREVLGN